MSEILYNYLKKFLWTDNSDETPSIESEDEWNIDDLDIDDEVPPMGNFLAGQKIELFS